MKYREIIQLAWDITTKEKAALFPFGFIPSVFATVVGCIYIAYQVIAFSKSSIFEHSASSSSYFELLSPLWQFMKLHPSWAVLIVLIVFAVAVMYLLVPILCGGGLIHLINRKLNGKELSGGFQRGLETFFPLFEFATITSPFSFFTFFTEITFVMRNFDISSWAIALPVMTSIFMVGIFLSLLFVFAEQSIVLKEDNVIQAMMNSVFLVLANVKDTLFLGVTLLLIALRVILNILIILIIPVVFISLVTFMASVALKWLGIILSVIIGVILILLSAYLMAGFHIFSYAVWTISFIYFCKVAEKNKS